MINFTAKALKEKFLIYSTCSVFLSLIFGVNIALGMEEKEEVNKSLHRKKGEAYLEKDLAGLTSQKDTRKVNDRPVEVTVFKVEKEKFDEDFSPHRLNIEGLHHHVNDGSFFAGQLRYTTNGFGFGTGTLISIEKNGENLVALGISVLHNFVEHDKSHFYKHATPGSVTFYQGNFDFKGTPVYIGTVSVDNIFIKVKEEIDDVCLFKGKIQLNTSFLNIFKENFSNDDYLSLFNGKVPSFLKDVKFEGKLNGLMYHYPLGISDQRRTLGSVVENNRHEILSFEGSSGAAILSVSAEKINILGIHDGFYIIDENSESVVDIATADETFRTLPVAKFNSYISFNDDYHKELLSTGHDIVSSRPHNVHKALVKFSEKFKLTES